MTIVCEKTGVLIEIDRTDGGKGRINTIRVYDVDGVLQVITNIYLNGMEIDTRKIEK